MLLMNRVPTSPSNFQATT